MECKANRRETLLKKEATKTNWKRNENHENTRERHNCGKKEPTNTLQQIFTQKRPAENSEAPECKEKKTVTRKLRKEKKMKRRLKHRMRKYREWGKKN